MALSGPWTFSTWSDPLIVSAAALAVVLLSTSATLVKRRSSYGKVVRG